MLIDVLERQIHIIHNNIFISNLTAHLDLAAVFLSFYVQSNRMRTTDASTIENRCSGLHGSVSRNFPA